MNPIVEPDPDQTMFGSWDSPLVEVTGVPEPPRPRTESEWLQVMRMMVREYGYPLPPKFVRPPGIDFDALLRQVPWPPSADQRPAEDE